MEILLLLIVLSIVVIAAKRFLRSRRRRALRLQSFPEDAKRLLEENFPLYRLLPQDLKNQLHGLINVFLDEKTFIGCRGQQITDQVRVTIAAQACMLLLNRQTKLYPWPDYNERVVAKRGDSAQDIIIAMQSMAIKSPGESSTSSTLSIFCVVFCR